MRKLIVAALAACSSVLLPMGLSAQAAETKPVPIDYFAVRNVVNTVAVSPDGQHVLVMKVVSKDGKYIIEIYNTSDFSKPIRTIGADPMEFFVGQAPRWVSDTVIIGGTWKMTRKKVRGPEDTAWDTLLFSYDIEKDKFKTLENKKTRFEGAGFSIVNMLTEEPDEILISTGTSVGDNVGIDPFALFRPRSYYKYNVKTGSKSLVLKGNDEYNNIIFDGAGRPRFASGIKDGYAVQYYRLPDQSGWTEFGERWDGNDPKDRYKFLTGLEGIQGWVKGKPETALYTAARGGERVALWEYDLVNDKFGKKLFEAPESDVVGLQFNSNAWGDPETSLVAARYPGAKVERHWFDQSERALFEQFESKIPNGHSINITSRSRDGQTMIVQNTGPKDPGSFWLVQNGKMAKLGSRNPLVSAEDLNDVKYIRYKARDGMTIPAYVTMPKGPGPHPLIVLPHGGPHVLEVIGYDEWGQFLANNGYMVLQPQYRMSVGWGVEHLRAGMGEHGLKMQDDKDDGALHLVKQGLADPDRMAMFGWSYGGYAALVAAAREPNLYQCTIAGAAVADAKKVYLKRSRGSSRLRDDSLDAWARARGGFVGINPIDEMDKVNIPVMMVHGDLDARVLYFNFKDYRNEMERVAKTRETGTCKGGTSDSECITTLYREAKGSGDSVIPMSGVSTSPGGNKVAYKGKSLYMTLKGADHYSITLMYEHQKKLYEGMLDFLENDCGPGGL